MNVFVILHYLSEEITVECVKKVMRLSNSEHNHVIIVDNASSNGSGERLEKRYSENPQCTVILNKKNLGFACGNNIGYKYAREHFDCNFIIIMNNDVFIEDDDFVKKIYNIYTETEYDVLGPDIFSCKTKIHQNPMKLYGYSQKEIISLIRTLEKWLTYYPLHYFSTFCKDKIKNFIKKLIHWNSTPANLVNTLAIQKRIKNPVLHGACLIFSSHFIVNETEAFNHNTFLYMEEDLLHYFCMKNNYKMVYDSSVSVNHVEDVATDFEFKSGYKKRKMKYNNLIKSARVLLNEMNRD